jgi:adenine-specific DNA-methyltransferase
MKLKQAILSVMGRDALKAAVDELDLDGVDRRSMEEMCARLSRVHRATPELLIEHLGETEVKVVCERVGIDPKGRRSALVESLLQTLPGIKPAKYDRTDVVQESEPVRWIRPEEVEMAEEPIDKPEVQNHRDPGRPFEITRTELVWPGKYDECGKLVEPAHVSLPFQVIEVIEEGRTSREGLLDAQMSLFGAKPSGLVEDGWRNKLIWGDNLLVEASLLKEFAGKFDLIYIDPPFATGADFHTTSVFGDDAIEVTKEQSLIEEKVYRDTWGAGIKSYLDMISARVVLLRDLLSTKGTLYLHCDYRTSHYQRAMLEDVFGADHFIAEIIWKRRSGIVKQTKTFGACTDTILMFSKSDDYLYNRQFTKVDSEKYIQERFKYTDEKGRRYRLSNLVNPGYRPTLRYEYKGYPPPTNGWAISMERMKKFDLEGRLEFPKDRNGRIQRRQFLDEWEGYPVQNLWTDIYQINPVAEERLDFPTQKPESLLQRLLLTSSNEGDLIGDLFSGSGTSLAVAEKLGRRWVGCDIGRFAIHTTRKRLLDLRVKNPETGQERGCWPFEILNLGKYERKYWQGITFGNEPKSNEETALAAYVRFILELYKAQAVQGTHIHGKKGGAFVHVGAVDAPVTISQIEDASAEVQRFGGKELHILGWEFEMGLHDPITQYVRAQHGVIVRLLSIPRETMEKRAVEAGDIQFFDLAYLELEIKPEKAGKKDRTVKVVLKDFVIPSTDLIPDEVRGKIKKWSDYIDYWAVDWDFRNDTFVNQWQTYRTRQNRSLALETSGHTYEKQGVYQVLVKVVDIFGNDTSHLVRWEVK